MKKWIHGLQVVVIAVLAWGSLGAAASYASDEGHDDLQTITSWMARLNVQYPGLNVEPSQEAVDCLDEPLVRMQLMWELDTLQTLLGEGGHLPGAVLKRIACGRPECTGGGGGRCSTCAFN